MNRLNSENASENYNPPLSLLDKLIYYSALFILLLPMVLFLIVAENIQRYFVFVNYSSVFACSPRAITYAGIIALCFHITVTVITVLVLLKSKRPIFGNKKIEYGTNLWPRDCYPIFGKQGKGINLSAERKRFYIKLTIIWSALFLVLVAILPFSYQSRVCLDKDDGIVSYNVFNQKTEKSYSMEDFSKVNIGTRFVRSHRSGSSWNWFVEIETVDGKIFEFDKKDFSYGFFRPDYEEGLKKMVEFKNQLPPEKITVDTSEVMNMLINYADNENMLNLFYELFSTN